jgi:hypothetical protein
MNDGFPIEFNLLRRFDEADRIRHDGGLTLELFKGERTNFSASYHYLGDEYDKNLFGLLFNRYQFFDAQFTHAFKNGSFLYANYNREVNNFKYRDLAHLLPNPQAPPARSSRARWLNTPSPIPGSVPAAAVWTVLNSASTGRLRKESYENGSLTSSMRSPSPATELLPQIRLFPRADSVVHAGANPYPDTVVRRHDVNIAILRRIKEDFAIGVRYWYEPYNQDDFSYQRSRALRAR